MKQLSKSKKQIILSHTLTYFNFLNLFLAGLILASGQVKNMLFLGIVISNAAIGIIQELKVKKLIDSISIVHQTTVKREHNGNIEEISTNNIECGDLILLQAGDQLVADGVITQSCNLEVNESLLTGESKPVFKTNGDSVYSGSFVIAGNGKMETTQIGDESYAHQLILKARTKKRATSEMQNAIKKIIRYVSFAIIPIGIALYLVQRCCEHLTHADAIVGTVAGIIGMIPEGLVLLTSVSFTLGVGRLAKKDALVQEMEAIEALARVNVLCCDKTGTITTGKLEVTEILPYENFSSEQIAHIMDTFAFAFENQNETGKALQAYFNHSGENDISNTVPFSSERKFSAVSIRGIGNFILGAPEFISQDWNLLQTSMTYAEKGYRVLLLAKSATLPTTRNEIKDPLPCALFLLTEQIRSDAKDTFRFFAQAGVEIKVISGDNPATVSSIAVLAGLNGGERYIDASTLPNNVQELSSIVNQYTVFGRVTPEQKQLLIKAFQLSGKVTGMVGDGVNDVLAIKDADCGIAMASGSNAAKQSAPIVLLNSDFATMTDIVDEGKTIIANIERVSALYLTKTIYSLLLCTLFIIMQKEYPFIPIQLSLIGATAIGIPSFFLTLEHNTKVTSNGFLRHVLRISLPCALLIAAGTTICSILGSLFSLPAKLISSINLLIGGAVSIFVVFVVCFPMNRKRILLCLLVSLLFACGFLFFPGFFGIKSTFLGIY